MWSINLGKYTISFNFILRFGFTKYEPDMWQFIAFNWSIHFGLISIYKRKI